MRIRSLLVLLFILVVACSTGAPKPKDRAQAQSEEQAAPSQSKALEQPVEVAPTTLNDLEKFSADIPGEGTLHATIHTSLGVIECKLFEELAPITVANFIGLASGKKEWIDPASGHFQQDKPFYDGAEFHRVIPHFFIQAGDPTGTGTAGPGYTIADEIADELSHDLPGILSMANRGAPDTGGSQWFITEAPVPHLDGRHTIFGYCGDSLKVVRSIARVPTGPDDRPQEPPTISEIQLSRRPASE